MKLPKSVRINGVDYSIEVVSGLNDGSEVLCGSFDEDDQVIKINKVNQTETGQFRTLLHEIGHAILYEHDLKNLGYDDRIPKSEETFCELFSRSVYQLIADNKELFTG